MRPPIDALEQDAVNLATKLPDRVHEAHAMSRLQLSGKLVDAAAAFLHIRTPALVGRDDFRAGNPIRSRGIVQRLRKGDDMRCIGADDAEPEVSRRQLAAQPDANEKTRYGQAAHQTNSSVSGFQRTGRLSR